MLRALYSDRYEVLDSFRRLRTEIKDWIEEIFGHEDKKIDKIRQP